MLYKVGGSDYSISYKDLRYQYLKFCAMSNTEFMRRLPKAIHFACIVCWFKEYDPDQTIGDEGIVHELAHLLDIGEYEKGALRKIRKQFKYLLKLD